MRSISWGSVFDFNICVFYFSYLSPIPCLDVWEVVVSRIVARIHIQYGLFAWCPEYLDDFDQLVILGLTSEGRLTIDHFDYDTADRPHINLRTVVGGTKDKLWSSIASWTDVSDIALFFRKGIYYTLRVVLPIRNHRWLAYCCVDSPEYCTVWCHDGQ